MEKSSTRRNYGKYIKRVQNYTLILQEEMTIIRKVNFVYYKKNYKISYLKRINKENKKTGYIEQTNGQQNIPV